MYELSFTIHTYVRAFTHLARRNRIEVSFLILYFKLLGFDQVELLHTDTSGNKKKKQKTSEF